MSKKQQYAEDVQSVIPLAKKSKAADRHFAGDTIEDDEKMNESKESSRENEKVDVKESEKDEAMNKEDIKTSETKDASKRKETDVTVKAKKGEVVKKPEKAPASRSKAAQKQNRASALLGIKKNDGRISRSYYIEKKFVALLDTVYGDDRGRSNFINDALRNFVLNNLPEYKDKINVKFHANIDDLLPFDEKKWVSHSTINKFAIRTKKKSEFVVQRSYYLEPEIVEVLDDLFGNGGSGRSDLVNLAIRFFILTYMEEFADSIDIYPPY